MKKVLGAIAGIFFFAFCIGVIGLMVTLTYSALGRIFPNSFENQMWGLVIFDIATLAWGMAFVFKSHSLGQYAAAGTGFLVGLIGTLGMIAAEVTLSGAELTGGTVDVVQIGRWMIYGFIACTALHVILVYTHHAAGPEIAQQISTGVARGQIRDKAIKDAEKQLEAETAFLARDITADIVQSVRRDLQLPIPADPRMPFLPAQDYKPVIVPSQEKPQSFFERILGKFGKKEMSLPQIQERTALLSNAWAAWKDQPDGSRRRLWCKVCRDQGLPWLTETACEHVLEAENEVTLTADVAMNTLRKLMSEQPEPSQDEPLPPLTPEQEKARGQRD